MKVCKFGGSSLANAAQLNKVIDIVLADPARRIVVVSAPGKRDSGDTKVTDLLIALAKTALNGENADRQFGAVVERYAEMAADLRLGDDIVHLIEKDLRDRLAQSLTLRPDEFLDLMTKTAKERGYDLTILMLTDVLREGTELLFIGDAEIIQQAFNTEISDNTCFLPGVMSRKKQIVPMLSMLWG